MKFNTLYKVNDKGKVQIFEIEIKQFTNGKIALITYWGQLNSTKQDKVTFIKGKAKRSDYSQAQNEGRAIFLKKKSTENYFTMDDLVNPSEDEIIKYAFTLPANSRIEPMLLMEARTTTFPSDPVLRKGAKRRTVSYPCLAAAKRDGICTTVTHDTGFTTRGMKDRHSTGGESWNVICKHILNDLERLWQYLKHIEITDVQMFNELSSYSDSIIFSFHGETYAHGLTLQEITSAVKKYNPHTSQLKLYIFDIIIEGVSMDDRRELLLDIAKIVDQIGLTEIVIVPGIIVRNEAELLVIENRVIVGGYEGIVVRTLKGMYQIGKRSSDVLKMVRMDETLVEIVDIVPMEKEPKMGKFLCRLDDGKKFYVTPGKGYTHDKRRELLKFKEEFINKIIKITHRGFTDEGIPRIATTSLT